MTTYDEKGNPAYCACPRGKIFGVCAKIARMFNWNVSVVRLSTIILAFLLPGITLITYLILGIIL